MLVEKSKISKAIDQLKPIIAARNEAKPAITGILVKNNCLTATNTELTIQIKMEEAAGNEFIIPNKAFDLIKSLPEGIVDISVDDKDNVQIKAKKIKNKYTSRPAEEFSYDVGNWEDSNGTVSVNGSQFVKCLSRVSFSAADNNSKKILNGICIDIKDNSITFVASDGHRIAWESLQTSDTMSAATFIIPKSSAKIMKNIITTDEDIQITYNSNAIIIKGKNYCIFTRLIEGAYLPYEKFTKTEHAYSISAKTAEILDAMTRARFCADDKSPLFFDVVEDELKVSMKSAGSDYSESIQLIKGAAPLQTAFNSRFILDAVKPFTSEYISFGFSSSKMPMVISSDVSSFKALVLPVNRIA